MKKNFFFLVMAVAAFTTIACNPIANGVAPNNQQTFAFVKIVNTAGVRAYQDADLDGRGDLIRATVHPNANGAYEPEDFNRNNNILWVTPCDAAGNIFQNLPAVMVSFHNVDAVRPGMVVSVFTGPVFYTTAVNLYTRQVSPTGTYLVGN